jgi:hypothetical protein
MSHTRVIERSERELALTDGLTPELRQCVHEFGFPIVDVLIKSGIRRASTIRHLVNEIWAGARQPRQRLYRAYPGKTVANKLDWVLTNAGAEISAERLVRVLYNSGFVCVPFEPTPGMVAASVAEVSGYNVRCTKSEKHRRRLVAALKVGHALIWDRHPGEEEQ